MNLQIRLEVNAGGYWEMKWTEGGKPRAQSTRHKDRIVAEAIMAAHVRKTTGTGIGALLDGYLAAAAVRGVTEGSTQEWCVARLRAWWADRDVTEVTPDNCQAYGASRGISGGSLRRELNTLGVALRWAVGHGLIERAPRIELPAEGAPRKGFLDELSEGELWELASQDTGRDGRLTRTGRFICIGLETGARKAAIEGLTWDRVDFGGSVIDFRDPEVRVTKKRRVATVMTTRLRTVLERAWSERRPGDVMVLDGPSAALVETGFENFMLRHGFEKVTPHVLRHTRITLLLRGGARVWDVAELVGVSSKVIESVYGHHVSDGRLAAVANIRG